jgi:fluoroacetyl-CoA thioesterase
MASIEPGLTNEIIRQVTERHLATEWGSGLVRVLATPVLVAFCEECARLAVDPLLPPAQQTVGTRIDLRHLAATPLGLDVIVRAELVESEGRRLSFRIEAWDTVERVAEAEHDRFVIDVERFEERLAEKSRQG